MAYKTRGEVESEFTKAIIKLEKEFLGRGPLEARTFLVHDMALVRLGGVLTPGEEKLAQTQEGKSLVKETRRQLFETSRPLLEEIVRNILGCSVVSMDSDISTKTNERVVILTLNANLDERFR
jgi:uncharacterized protein YbcI